MHRLEMPGHDLFADSSEKLLSQLQQAESYGGRYMLAIEDEQRCGTSVLAIDKTLFSQAIEHQSHPPLRSPLG